MLELGLGASAALSTRGRGRVVGVYARAAYLEVPGGLVALTAPGVPMGPIHARTPGSLDLLRVGHRVVVSPGLLQAGPLLLHFGAAPLWRGCAPAPRALERAALLAVRLLAAAPPSSLPVPVPAGALRAGDVGAVAACLGGAGPGLTPAGDDCLAGILLVARIRWGEAAESLLVDAAERVLTNDVARAFLTWAARGQSIEPVHDLLLRAAAFDHEGASKAVSSLTRLGHSSGADLALGLRLALGLLPATLPATPPAALHVP